MNCFDIIEKYLKDNGYDGLVCTEISCGCGFKEDNLYGCDCAENIIDCVPAYAVKMSCEKDCDSEHECYDPDRIDKWCYTIKNPDDIKGGR